MNYPSLFSPLRVGPYQLKHRLALAPLTRMRAEKPSLAPRPLNAEYYAQRAAGRIADRGSLACDGNGFWQPRGARYLYRATGRRLAKGGRRRSRQGRRDLPPTLARRPRLAFLVPARRRAAGRAIGGRDPARFEDGDGGWKGHGPGDATALETSEIPAWSTRTGRLRRTRFSPASTVVEIHGANGYLDRAVSAIAPICADQYGGSSRTTPLPDGSDEGPWSGLGCKASRRRAAVALRDCQWQRRARPHAALRVRRPVAEPVRARLSAFDRAALSAAPAAPKSTIRTCRRRWCCLAPFGTAC